MTANEPGGAAVPALAAAELRWPPASNAVSADTALSGLHFRFRLEPDLQLLADLPHRVSAASSPRRPGAAAPAS